MVKLFTSSQCSKSRKISMTSPKRSLFSYFRALCPLWRPQHVVNPWVLEVIKPSNHETIYVTIWCDGNSSKRAWSCMEAKSWALAQCSFKYKIVPYLGKLSKINHTFLSTRIFAMLLNVTLWFLLRASPKVSSSQHRSFSSVLMDQDGPGQSPDCPFSPKIAKLALFRQKPPKIAKLQLFYKI